MWQALFYIVLFFSMPRTRVNWYIHCCITSYCSGVHLLNFVVWKIGHYNSIKHGSVILLIGPFDTVWFQSITSLESYKFFYIKNTNDLCVYYCEVAYIERD